MSPGPAGESPPSRRRAACRRRRGMPMATYLRATTALSHRSRRPGAFTRDPCISNRQIPSNIRTALRPTPRRGRAGESRAFQNGLRGDQGFVRGLDPPSPQQQGTRDLCPASRPVQPRALLAKRPSPRFARLRLRPFPVSRRHLPSRRSRATPTSSPDPPAVGRPTQPPRRDGQGRPRRSSGVDSGRGNLSR